MKLNIVNYSISIQNDDVDEILDQYLTDFFDKETELCNDNGLSDH